MCSEGLLLTYITICDFTCSFIFRNEVVFGICAESFYAVHSFNHYTSVHVTMHIDATLRHLEHFERDNLTFYGQDL